MFKVTVQSFITDGRLLTTHRLRSSQQTVGSSQQTTGFTLCGLLRTLVSSGRIIRGGSLLRLVFLQTLAEHYVEVIKVSIKYLTVTVRPVLLILLQRQQFLQLAHTILAYAELVTRTPESVTLYRKVKAGVRAEGTDAVYVVVTAKVSRVDKVFLGLTAVCVLCYAVQFTVSVERLHGIGAVLVFINPCVVRVWTATAPLDKRRTGQKIVHLAFRVNAAVVIAHEHIKTAAGNVLLVLGTTFFNSSYFLHSVSVHRHHLAYKHLQLITVADLQRLLLAVREFQVKPRTRVTINHPFRMERKAAKLEARHHRKAAAERLAPVHVLTVHCLSSGVRRREDTNLSTEAPSVSGKTPPTAHVLAHLPHEATSEAHRTAQQESLGRTAKEVREAHVGTAERLYRAVLGLERHEVHAAPQRVQSDVPVRMLSRYPASRCSSGCLFCHRLARATSDKTLRTLLRQAFHNTANYCLACLGRKIKTTC